MAVYKDNAAGVTAAIGLDSYLVTGGIDQYGPIIGELTDGATYPYYCAYIDVADGLDYETGQGVWDNGTNTLSRILITTSSNAGAAVNWGVGNKALWITQDALLATDMQNMVEGSTKKILTVTERSNIAASKTKTDLITVTIPANLDTMQADIAAFSSGMTYRGNWDASTGVFPGGGVGSNGDYWYCSVSGVVNTISFNAGDSIVALVNNPSISTFAGNWSRHESFSDVQMVNGQVGVVELDAADVGAVAKFEFDPLVTPLCLVVFGDSNVDGFLGGSDVLLNVNNANVYTYCTDGASPYSNSTLAFRNLSPNGQGGSSTTAGTGTLTVTSLTNFDTFASRFANGTVIEFITQYADGSTGFEWTRGTYSANTLTRTTVILSTNSNNLVNWTSAAKNVTFINPTSPSNATGPTWGIKQSAIGNIGWSAADQLQKMTGKPVYLIPVSASGTTIEYWQPGGGAGKEGMTDLLAKLSTAIAAIPSGPGIADVVFMEDGSNDAGAPIAAADFVTKWQTMYAQFVASGWIDSAYTQWLQGEPPQSYAPYGATRWDGFRLLARATGPELNIVPSVGLNTADTVHLTCQSLDQKGRTGAIMSNVGKSRNDEEKGSNRYVTPNTGRAFPPTYTQSPIDGGGVAQTFDTWNTFTSGKLFSWQNKTVEKAYVAYDGTYSGTGFRTTGGVYTSTVVDDAAAKAHVFNTPAYTSTAKIASFQNNSVEQAFIDQAGTLACNEVVTDSGFISNFFGSTAITLPLSAYGGYKSYLPDGAAAVAHDFSSDNALTTTAKLASFKNQTTEKAYISQDGSFWSAANGTFVGTLGVTGLATFATATLNGLMNGSGSISLASTISGSALNATNATLSGTVASLYYTVGINGNYTALTTNGASAIGHKFVTPAYATGGAKLASFFNDTVEKISFDFDGVIQGAPASSTIGLRPNPTSNRGIALSDFNIPTVGLFDAWGGTYGRYWQSAKENVATGAAFGFNATTTLTTGDILYIANNNTKKVIINYQGAPGFWGATPVTARVASGAGNNTPSTAGSGVITILNTSLWNGGSGTGYSISDIVKSLKDAGLLA